MGTALCFMHTATSLRNMFAMNGVVGTATSNLSGHTLLESVMTYSSSDALRSQRAAFSPAAYCPRACRLSSIVHTSGSDSTSSMPRMMALLSLGIRF